MTVRIAAVTVLLAATAVARAGNADERYDRAMAAVADGRYAAAVEEARAIEEPLLRAQALVYAYFRGRDYAAALTAAEAGLASAGDDETGLDARLWLADRALAAATYFEAVERARRWFAWLDERVAALPEGELRASWSAAVRAHGETIAELERAERERADAVGRARRAALLLAGLALGLGAFLLAWRPAQTSSQSLP